MCFYTLYEMSTAGEVFYLFPQSQQEDAVLSSCLLHFSHLQTLEASAS